MTQEQFADLLGVTRKTIVNYESGGNIPVSKVKLFESILNSKNNEEHLSSTSQFYDDITIDETIIDKILEKFKDISIEEVALYVNFKKEKMLNDPLMKSIIKSEAWKIIELEMRNVLIEKRKENN